MKKMIPVTLMMLVMAIVSRAQGPAPEVEIKIKKIDVDLQPAPRYTLTKNVPQTDSTLRWLLVEAELECQPEWADEVIVKFYVVANYGNVKGDYVPADKYDILAATVTVVNMQRNIGTGRKNFVPVFLDANSVKKYGAVNKAQFIPQVAVQVMYKGRVQDTQWMTAAQKDVRFWETKSPKGGILMNLMQSPWWPAYGDFYEQVKSGPAAPAY